MWREAFRFAAAILIQTLCACSTRPRRCHDAMGRSGKAKGAGKGLTKGGEQAKESQYVKRVDLYKFPGKWMLRSYPDERGCPLMFGAGKQTQTAAAALDASGAGCRLLRALEAANHGAQSGRGVHGLLGRTRPAQKAGGGAPKADRGGFHREGPVLQLGPQRAANARRGPEHCKALLRKVRHLVRDHGEDIAAGAEATAGVFLGLVSVLEVAAVSKDLRAWAKSVPERKKQSKHLQAWLQDPEDEDKFFAAVQKHQGGQQERLGFRV